VLYAAPLSSAGLGRRPGPAPPTLPPRAPLPCPPICSATELIPTWALVLCPDATVDAQDGGVSVDVGPSGVDVRIGVSRHKRAGGACGGPAFMNAVYGSKRRRQRPGVTIMSLLMGA
jgi:hypothetical protein